MEDLTKDKLRIFEELFDLIDLENDGSITFKELGIMLRNMGCEVGELELQGMINEADTNGNGSLDLSEFTHLLVYKMCDTDQQDNLRDAFSVFDKDNNGFISTAELRTIFTSIGLKVSDDEIEELIREADLDQDGVLVFEEFANMMTSKDF